MTSEDAKKIRKGSLLVHRRYGRAVARGTVQAGGRVWIDTPENQLAPDLPYNADISQLEFKDG